MINLRTVHPDGPHLSHPGPALDPPWIDLWPAPDQPGTNPGPTLNRFWIDPVLSLERPMTNLGPALDRPWNDPGSMDLGSSLDSSWTNPESTLNQPWTDTGTTQGWPWTCMKPVPLDYFKAALWKVKQREVVSSKFWTSVRSVRRSFMSTVNDALLHANQWLTVSALNAITGGVGVDESRCARAKWHLSDSEIGSWPVRTGGWRSDTLSPGSTEEAEPSVGNGALLLATEDAALFIPPHDWKENWMPFDVINLSITAFAHKMSVQIIEQKQDSGENM